MDLKTLVMTAFQVSLLLTVFSFGLSARLQDLLFLFRRPGLLLRSLLTMFVIMPVAALLLVRLFEAPRTVEIVLVALAISPIPPLLPRKFRKVGATTGYGLGLLTAASLLSIVIVPVMTQLLGRYFLPFTMSPPAIASMIIADCHCADCGRSHREAVPAGSCKSPRKTDWGYCRDWR